RIADYEHVHELAEPLSETNVLDLIRRYRYRASCPFILMSKKAGSSYIEGFRLAFWLILLYPMIHGKRLVLVMPTYNAPVSTKKPWRTSLPVTSTRSSPWMIS